MSWLLIERMMSGVQSPGTTCSPRRMDAARIGKATMKGWMSHFITLGFQGLEPMLTGATPFSHGDRPGLADLCLLPQVYNARRWGVELAPYRRIAAIVSRMEAMPAVAAAHPDRVRPEG